MKLLTCFIAIFFTVSVSAQSSFSDTLIRTNVQQMPQYPGGMQALAKLLTKCLTDEPPSVKWEELKDDDIKTSVKLSFIIDEQGNVSDVRVIESMDKVNDERLVNAVKKLKFIPAMEDGKPVKVRYILPYSYTLPAR